MALVLDASIVMSWLFDDEPTPDPAFRRRCATDQVLVPSHWRAEVANALLTGERRGSSTSDQSAKLRDILDLVDAEVDREGGDHAIDRILPLARAYRLTVYDAIYLELAEREGVPLATVDRLLAGAARAAGLEVMTGKPEA